MQSQPDSFKSLVGNTAPPRIPLPQVIESRPTLPDAPFGEMVAFAVKWLLAFALAWVILGIPVGVILYFLLR